MADTDKNNVNQATKIRFCLLLLRVSIFFVMSAWTIDKMIRPEHATMIYQDYYYLPATVADFMFVIGLVEMIILVSFVTGYRKAVSYGLVLLFHTVSTLAPFYQYASGQLLFYAGVPMWAACLTLFLLRDLDTLVSFNK